MAIRDTDTRIPTYSQADPQVDPVVSRTPIASEPVVAPVAPAPVTSDPDAPLYGSRPDVVRDEPRRFSLGATFLGWAVASFFTLVFLALLGGILGGTLLAGNGAGLTSGNINQIGLTAIIGTLLSLFLAYLIGGYAAGRISMWDGAKHGMATVMWTVLFGILLFVLGATVGSQFAYLLPIIPLDAATITTGSIILLVLSLVAMLAGGALGGRLGERRDRYATERYESRRMMRRGRPL